MILNVITLQNRIKILSYQVLVQLVAEHCQFFLVHLFGYGVDVQRNRHRALCIPLVCDKLKLPAPKVQLICVEKIESLECRVAVVGAVLSAPLDR